MLFIFRQNKNKIRHDVICSHMSVSKRMRENRSKRHRKYGHFQANLPGGGEIQIEITNPGAPRTQGAVRYGTEDF